MTGLIPRLQSHLVLTALAVLTALWPPIGHPALEVQENRLLLTTGTGRTFYVAPGGSDSADGSAQSPWATFQHAADVVNPGDVVHFAPGTYNSNIIQIKRSGTASQRIRFISDTKWGAKIVMNVSGNSWGTNRIININEIVSYVDVVGFDCTSPYAYSGIFNEGYYNWILNNQIHDMTNRDSDRTGGGIADDASYNDYTTHDAIISGNVVHDIGTWGVTGQRGLVHGIYCTYPSGEIVTNNIVYHNVGLGIHGWHNFSNATIANNLVFNNGQSGILIANAEAIGGKADNCIVANNISVYNGVEGYYGRAGIEEEGQVGNNNKYYNNCLYGNPDGATSLKGSSPVQGTVSSDPRFVNYQADGTGDYHLVSGSPCIDAGTSLGAPATDIEGVSRPQGAGVDIGPYEWVPLGSRGTPSPGRSAPASQVDRSQHAPMLYALLGVSGVAMVLLVALVFVLRIRKAS